MDLPAGPVASWSLSGTPTVTSGALAANPGFTGHASCDRAGQNNPSATASFPASTALNLVDGIHSLAPGQSDQLNFTVTVTLKPSGIGTGTILSNKAWAAALVSNTVNVTAASLITASATSTDVLLTDPEGIVYNSATRQPVSGAIVTMSRNHCQNSTVSPILPAELYYGTTSNTYTFNTDGSVSMTTTASGNYQFFFKTPPVADLCTYLLTVAPPANSSLHFPSAMIPTQSGSYNGCAAVNSVNTAPQGSNSTLYYTSVTAGYNSGTQTSCQVLHNNIPLDPGSLTGLVLQKQGSQTTAEAGDFIDYILTLTNNTGSTLTGINFTDTLPPGLAYQSGTSRLNGVVSPDPVGGHGPGLQFNIPAYQLAAKAAMTLSYRVRIGIGAPLNTDAVNRAQAQSGQTGSALQSNQAAWRVHVNGGVFADDAFLFGKVFLDCDGDHVQGREEVGIPGVRLFLEDGTGVVTDVEGKWSLYGLRPVTHALKLDKSTLPAGAELELMDNRQAGVADSQFVDMRNGELRKANFAVSNCDNKAMVHEVMIRRKNLALNPISEGEAARANVRMDPSGKPIITGDTRGLPSSGSVDSNGSMSLTTTSSGSLIDIPDANSSTAPLIPVSGIIPAAPIVPVFTSLEHNTGRKKAESPLSDTSAIATVPQLLPGTLEDLVPTMDNKLAFIDMKEGDTLSGLSANVRVKGLRGATLRLTVNGQIVDKKRVGKKASLEINKVSAWEYISVSMQAGNNELLLEAMDDSGKIHESKTIHVIAPDKLSKLIIDAPQAASGDGKTPVKIHLRLLDANGVPVAVKTAITLESTLGRWNVIDLNAQEPGTQTFITGGSADLELVPPSSPGDGRIRISAGTLIQEARIAFLPDLRPLSGVGLLEGVISMHNGAPVGSVMAKDTFEAELTGMSRGSGENNAQGRAAFFLKGTIKGEYLLTASYDSNKSTQERMFRDIQPDAFYPVYGDSSAKVFDAQSTGRLYVRIDKNRSYLLLGDFNSSSSSEVRQLTQVSRTLTGLQHRYEDATTRITSFASHDSITQQIIEFPANGTSGPFVLGGVGDLLANSEQVQLIVRDRNQPGIILSTTPLTRFTDYTIDPLSRTILFTHPIASLDPELNPESIRITFAVDTGGPAFWVAGVDAQTKLTPNIQLGAIGSYDGNPSNNRRLGGLTGLFKFSDHTSLATEFASTESDLAGRGEAGRIELHHTDSNLHAQALFAKVGDSFDNPSATMPAGHTEINASGDYKLTETAHIRAQVLSSKDELSNAGQHGALISLQNKLSPVFTSEVGVRNGQQTNATGGTFDYGSVSAVGAGATSSTTTSAPATATITDSFTSLRARLTANLPSAPQNQIFVEAEQVVDDPTRRVLALGGNTQLSDKVRLYGRYKFIDSLNGPYTLTSGQSTNVGLIGLDSTYMKDGRTYEELRLADTMDGRSAQAATGIRNTFSLAEGWKANAGIEHTSDLNTITGIPGGSSNALTGGLNYLGTGIFKDRVRANIMLEVRHGDESSSTLSNIGVAYKLNQDWSLLARSITSESSVSNSAAGTGSTLLSTGNTSQDRQQIGLAYRPVDQDVWNALARYDYKHATNDDGASGVDPVTGLPTLTPENTTTHMISAHLNVQPDAKTQLDGRWAGKITHYVADAIASSYTAQLVQGRLTRDLTPCWDIGTQLAVMWSPGGALQRSAGLEAGYQVATNLWASLGYNILGLRDPDLTANEYTDKGIYLRLRFKFDETILTEKSAKSTHVSCSDATISHGGF